MQVNIQQTQKLVNGNQSFTQLGFNMMLTRLRSMYRKDPSTDTLQLCMNEVNVFMDKFAVIMGSDYELITKL